MLFFITYLFYKDIYVVFLSSPFLYFYLKYKKTQIIKERKWQLTLQFREGILSLSAALNAGYSIENAFIEALEDVKLLYSKDAFIVKEFSYIIYQIQVNQTIENALEDLGNRSQVEEIYSFSQLFITVKRTGGDIIKIISKVGKNLSDKLEMEREIKTLISAKKFETKIMCMIPFGIILYLWICSPGFLDLMYHNFLGNIIMTMLLMLYGVAYFLIERIMDIRL